MIEIILIIAAVIINGPFQPGDFSTGSTTDIHIKVKKRQDQLALKLFIRNPCL